MKKVICFLLMLALFACEKSEDSTPKTTAGCVVIQGSVQIDDPDGLFNESRYVRDEATGRLMEVHNFEDNIPKGYNKFTYDTKGNIILREAYYDGTLTGKQTFEYNIHNQLIYSLYSSVPDISTGELVESTSYTFEYSSPTQLKKITYGYPRYKDQSAYETFDYENEQIRKINLYHTYRNESQLFATYSLEYDDKKYRLSTDSAYRKTLLQPTGLPLKHNIKKISLEYLKEGGINTWGRTSTFTYNNQGYPIQEIRMPENGKKQTYNHSYDCK